MTLLTERGLRNLARDASQARQLILRHVLEAETEIGGRRYWGQFLDLPHRHDQHGIYGAAAAIEILAVNGYSTTNDLIRGAVASLPILGDGRDYPDVSDTGLVLKIASLSMVAGVGSDEVAMNNVAVVHLLSLAADDRGWGTYAFPPGSIDLNPQVIPTAMSLLALKRVRRWRSESRCRSTLEWLGSQMAAGATTETEDALGLLALSSYRSPGVELPAWDEGLRAATARVGEALHRSHGSVRSVRYHYPVVLPSGAHENMYMFFLPSVIGSLALMRAAPTGPVPASGEVVATLRTVVSSIIAEGAFLVDARIATVDQLWIDRALRAFQSCSESPSRLVPVLFSPLASRTGRLTVAGILLLLALGGGYVGYTDSLSTWLRALGSFVAAACAGLVVTELDLFGGGG